MGIETSLSWSQDSRDSSRIRIVFVSINSGSQRCKTGPIFPIGRWRRVVWLWILNFWKKTDRVGWQTLEHQPERGLRLRHGLAMQIQKGSVLIFPKIFLRESRESKTGIRDLHIVIECAASPINATLPSPTNPPSLYRLLRYRLVYCALTTWMVPPNLPWAVSLEQCALFGSMGRPLVLSLRESLVCKARTPRFDRHIRQSYPRSCEVYRGLFSGRPQEKEGCQLAIKSVFFFNRLLSNNHWEGSERHTAEIEVSISCRVRPLEE